MLMQGNPKKAQSKTARAETVPGVTASPRSCQQNPDHAVEKLWDQTHGYLERACISCRSAAGHLPNLQLLLGIYTG